MRISDWSSDVCSSDLHRLEGAPAFDLARLRQVRWAVLLLGFAARHRALQPVHRRFALAFYLLARRRVVVDARRYLRCGKAGDAGYVGERHREYGAAPSGRSEEHTSELQSLMRSSYAVFCLKKKKRTHDSYR